MGSHHNGAGRRNENRKTEWQELDDVVAEMAGTVADMRTYMACAVPEAGVSPQTPVDLTDFIWKLMNQLQRANNLMYPAVMNSGIKVARPEAKK